LEQLAAMLKSGARLSARSLNALELDQPSKSEYIDAQKKLPLTQETTITCVSVAYRAIEEEGRAHCLVVGSEAQFVYILSPNAVSVKAKVKVPAVPVAIAVSGTIDVGYRAVVACRSTALYTIKGGELMSSSIDLEAAPVELCFTDPKTLVVACMNSSVHAFNPKNKKIFSIKTPAPVCALEPMVMNRASSFRGFIVALKDGEVRVYNGTSIISQFTCIPSFIHDTCHCYR
jgi:Bardet-Biedl syndrome 1 protein